MSEQPNTIENLAGKPIEQLTDAELASLSETIETRRKNLREAQQKEQFDILTRTAGEVVTALGYEKLPKITLTPDTAGKNWEVSLVAGGVKTPVTRTTPDVNGGDITIKKIGTAKGGIAKFKNKAGKEFTTIQELVKALKQPDGKPEADRCWDISKKGISSSDIIIRYHANEITLVYENGDEQLVKDAVEEVKSARAVA